MKGKASLPLLEQIIMLLVFAVAAALCFRAFAWADGQSRGLQEADSALVQVQSAAEVLKNSRGNLADAAGVLGGTTEADSWTLYLNSAFVETQTAPCYRLTAQLLPRKQAYLGSAAVTLTRTDGTQIAALTVYWQEDTPWN